MSEPGARKKSVAASVRARLLNRARETQQDFNLVLTRFCLERLLSSAGVWRGSGFRPLWHLKA